MNDLARAPIGRLLGIAGRLVGARFQRLLDDEGLSYAAFQVLLTLGDEHLTQRDIAGRCYVTPATVSGLVEVLERDGLVARERGTDDRRLVRVRLTPHGRDRLAGIRERAGEHMAPIFGDLSAREEAVVRKFLVRTIDRLEER